MMLGDGMRAGAWCFVHPDRVEAQRLGEREPTRYSPYKRARGRVVEAVGREPRRFVTLLEIGGRCGHGMKWKQTKNIYRARA
jgi:hypothetical protein